MTKAEYAQFESTFTAFMEAEGRDNLSSANDEEPYFSWHPCDCCRRPLGGMRYEANGYNPTTKEVQEYKVCEDCLYYSEYGQLDDQTM